jgi:hypothetical protein
MKHLYLSVCLAVCQFILSAQVKKKVLFIGNSYTFVNNLPQVLKDMALSLGDTVQYDSSTQGGYSFQNHCNDANTQAKIKSQKWDVVVLQAQSQEPSFPPAQVLSATYPFADRLVDSVRKNNPCTDILFYMTWGRQNGDPSNCATYAPLCTYAGMQTRLRQSYMLFKDSFMTGVAPVGVAWQKIRTINPTINLYDPDQSHPSIQGTYLAASVFYSSIFLRSSVTSTYTSGINSTDATTLRTTASTTVLDSTALWNLRSTVVVPQFTYTSLGNNAYSFQNTSVNASIYTWSFGSTQASPTHTFSGNAPYQVKLVAKNDCNKDSVQMSIGTITSVQHMDAKQETDVYPNPFVNEVAILSKDEIRRVSITNQLGEIVASKTVEEKATYSYNFRLPDLTPGIYYLSVQSKDGTSHKRLVKN